MDHEPTTKLYSDSGPDHSGVHICTLPKIVLPPNGEDIDSRPQTPISVSTAVTSDSNISEWSLKHISPSPYPIQGSPLSVASFDDSSDIPKLSLSSSDTIQMPQKRKDSATANSQAQSLPSSPTLRPTVPTSHNSSRSCPGSPQLRPAKSGSKSASPKTKNPFDGSDSSASREWARRKRNEFEESEVIDELMKFQGLEEVKQQFLDIKSKVDVCKEQGRNLGDQRFNVVFQGNPGTGKTTIARLYAKFLHEMGILESDTVKETSGIKLATKGATGTKNKLKRMLARGGGVLFIDEAYQLISGYIDGYGRQVLDIVLTYMENNIGKLVVIFVGYKDEMEPFFEHNPGLSSRIPYLINFADFTDAQLWNILRSNIIKRYNGKMKVQDGLDGLYMRITIRRLAQARGSRSFGNARAVQNLLDRIEQRQAQRLTREKRFNPDLLTLTKEDLIGPDPSKVAKQCPAWEKLQELIGLQKVKTNVDRMIGMINANYKRELSEQKPFKFSLNSLFVGEPGTGKTTVANLYGQILAHLGYLSRGDVVLKTPADFIGECLGKSEAKTKKILETTVGKVLVIDEAYMLDAGDPHKDQDKFKTGVIDTIVSMVQGVPGEDRCIILVGYQDKLRDMFNNVNPGLSRRFPADRPFVFENFNIDQLEQILRLKLRDQELTATDRAIVAARDIFERALMRPRFTNAGEVDSLLTRAKMNYEERQSKLPFNEQVYDGQLEEVDITTDFNQASASDINCYDILNGRVHSSIIEKLISYQKRCLGARSHGLNPREQVPTNFVFKGYPGTGKTITAQSMGKIFYAMGFLSNTDVVECSAIDLLGQYVGHTAPKTRKKLQESLGKVLFIDEAYRLMYNQYAAEAVDELIQYLTQPANLGKVVVILAGRIADMNQLMMMRPELSGLFPEEIVFENIPSEDCITLLKRELIGFNSEDNFLANPKSTNYDKVNRLFKALEAIPTWSNARDVKNLAKNIVGNFLETSDPETSSTRTLSFQLVYDCMGRMIIQQRGRFKSENPTDNISLSQKPSLPRSAPSQLVQDMQQIPPAPVAAKTFTTGLARKSTMDGNAPTKTNCDTSIQSRSYRDVAMAPRVPMITDRQRDGGELETFQADNYDDDDDDDEAGFREDGVPDDIWHELCQAQKDESLRRNQRRSDIKRLEQEIAEAEENPVSGSGTCSGQGSGNCDGLRDELNNIQKKILEEKEIHKALEHMGRCPVGYLWTPLLGGYRCEGGSHYVTDDELRRYMR